MLFSQSGPPSTPAPPSRARTRRPRPGAVVVAVCAILATLLSGVGGMRPSTEGAQWLLTNLALGKYVATRMVVDPIWHKTHAAVGMLTSFTVV